MKVRSIGAKIALVLLASSGIGAVNAQSADWQQALQPELELSSHLSERLNIRFGVNQESASLSASDRPAFQLLDDDSMQFSALVDWSLSDGGIRMTGGAVYGDELLTESDFPLQSLSTDHMSTCVGVGWDNDFGTRGRFGLSLDMGLTFDEPTTAVELDESRDTTAEDASLGSTFQSFRYEPSFSAGVEYRF